MSDRLRWGLTTNFPGAFINILASMVIIFTLGWVCPSWHLRFLCWRMEQEMRRRINERPPYQ